MPETQCTCSVDSSAAVFSRGVTPFSTAGGNAHLCSLAKSGHVDTGGYEAAFDTLGEEDTTLAMRGHISSYEAAFNSAEEDSPLASSSAHSSSYEAAFKSEEEEDSPSAPSSDHSSSDETAFNTAEEDNPSAPSGHHRSRYKAACNTAKEPRVNRWLGRRWERSRMTIVVGRFLVNLDLCC